ncbi:MAG TPA: hypothetical protein VJV79_31030 [Polyangiaceae bacterium]|nr:hypothetical protein [Polyangiaceae bacterium]
MHQSARDQIVSHLAWFEGSVPYMYLDSIGLVTTGIGNLLDPYSQYGKRVRFSHSDGRPATEAEVRAEFTLVKSKTVAGGNAPQAAFRSYRAFEPITKLRIAPADLSVAVQDALRAHEAAAVSYFGRDFDTFPADVQVVLLQMSYAGGLYSRRVQLSPLLKRRDFVAAREYTYLTNAKQGKAGYKTYNAAFRMMMMNGSILDQCAKLKMVHWSPKDISVFYGFKRGLQLSRWYTGNDMSLAVKTSDVVTEGNYEGWLRNQQ